VENGMKALARFWSDESGQSMVEYGLIIGAVVVGVAAILVAFKAPLKNIFNNTQNDINNASQ
jgi:Flp pilus assembly pilin Flp